MILENKTAIVTGVSRGIGLATVTALLKKKVRVAGWGINDPKITSSNFHFIKTNVRKQEQVKAAAQQTQAKFGNINILVNNAGLGYFANIDEMPVEQWMEMFDTNVHGVYYCCHEIIPQMKKQKSGHIINLSSIAGQMGIVQGAGYCGTKFAVKGISQVLFKELRPFNIKVSCLYPGSTNTDFFKRSSNAISYDSMMKPEDIANTIIYFLETPDGLLPVDIELRPMAGK